MSMVNKQKLKVYIIYALPVAFLLVGIWAFLNVHSMHYTRAISLIDWLLSGDDGEEEFHQRLKEDLENFKIEEDEENF